MDTPHLQTISPKIRVAIMVAPGWWMLPSVMLGGYLWFMLLSALIG